MIAALTPLLASMGPAALALICVILIVETGLMVGSFLPGDSLLFAVGVLSAARALPVPLWVLLPVCAAAALVGDQVGYSLGHRYGPRIFTAESRWLNRRHADRATAFFARHGGRAVVLARFVPVVRGFTPAAAGLAGMPRRSFTLYNVAGGIGWVTLMLVAGYYTGGVPLIAHHIEWLAIGLAAAGAAPVAAAWLLGKVRRHGSGSRLGGQVEDEPSATEGAVLDPDLAAEGEDGLAHDRQAESAPA